MSSWVTRLYWRTLHLAVKEKHHLVKCGLFILCHKGLNDIYKKTHSLIFCEYNVLTPGQHRFWGDSLSLCTSLSPFLPLLPLPSSSPPIPAPLSQSLCPFSPLFLCCMYHLPSWCCLWKSRNFRLMAEAEAATAICIPYDMISLLYMAVVHRIVSQQIKHPSKKQCYTQSEILTKGKIWKDSASAFCDGTLGRGVTAIA